ncbi:fibronectin type III domain-containing protein [bacterium]|nr:fibronectin type III domain-containing protein [bacterium]
MFQPKNLVPFALLMILGTSNFLWSQEKTCPIGPHQGNWSLREPLPEETSEFGAVSVNGLIFTAGGYLPENNRSLLMYDIKNNRWTRALDLPKGTHHPALVSVNNKLYVIGGHMAEDAVQIYDPVSKKWTQGKSLPTPRVAMASVVLNGKIHLIGGTTNINQGIALNAHEVYDPVKDSWQTRASLPVASEHVQAGVLKGRIHVVGGRNRFRNMDLNQIYNPATNTWSTGAAMNRARSGMGAAVFEKRLYVFGGEDLIGRSIVNSVERYDLDSNSWELLNPMIHAVHGNPAAVFQRFIYVFGGAEDTGSGDGSNYLQRLDISNSPKQPKNLTATALSSTCIRLKWADLSDNEDSYLIQRKNKNSFQTIFTLQTNSKQFDVKSLTPGTAYSFRVVAQNGRGSSAPSNIASATTKQ